MLNLFRRIPFGILLLIALIFVGLGDQFLPQPLSGASLQARTTLNQFLFSLVPGWQPRVSPHQRSEDAVRREEQGGKQNP